MVEFHTSKKEKLSIRDSVLGLHKKILELSNTEFRSSYNKLVIIGDEPYYEYVPSTSKGYIQSVEHLGYALFPFFDKAMQEIFDKYLEDVREIPKAVREEYKGQSNFKGTRVDQIISSRTLELCEGLFCDLNLLLKRLDYLKSSTYSEDDMADDDVELDEGEK